MERETESKYPEGAITVAHRGAECTFLLISS